MHVIEATNVRDALPQAVQYLLRWGDPEETRIGKALVAPGPVTIHYLNPKEHVLLNPIRDANPFFHLMEAMWMIAGRDDSAFLDFYIRGFSKRFATNGTVMDSYGQRWRRGYRYDQLDEVVAQLRKNPTSRQVVLQMWGAGRDDLRSYSAKPCNLIITFRIARDRLDMTVFNRSNDLVWGCCGANAVHFPMLQEYLAGRMEVDVGGYWQVSTNLHLYEEHIKMFQERGTVTTALDLVLEDKSDYGITEPLVKYPLQFDEELYETMDVLDKIQKYQEFIIGDISNTFLSETVIPMAQAHAAYKGKNMNIAWDYVSLVKANDWQRAGREWLERRYGTR